MSWLKKNLFNSYLNTSITIVILFVLALIIPGLLSWTVFDSVLQGTSQDCREASGACWAFIAEKYKLILVWQYPRDQLWRPLLALVLFIFSLIYVSNFKVWNKATPFVFAASISLVLFILYGGLFLEVVEVNKWGGLIITIFLAATSIFFAYPLAIVLALGRRSKLPVIRTASTVYIEVIRGVPLISLLFMASVMLPFVLPSDWTLDKLSRVTVAIIIFATAYQAEVIRGGLQGVGKGQYEAAHALGLSYWQTNMFIVLPQALKIVIPATMNVFISVFLDTSLVIIVSMFDLIGATKGALVDYKWLGYSQEAYIFIGAIYFIFCFSMARYSLKLENHLKRGYN